MAKTTSDDPDTRPIDADAQEIDVDKFVGDPRALKLIGNVDEIEVVRKPVR